jgi:hypothetical protein
MAPMGFPPQEMLTNRKHGATVHRAEDEDVVTTISGQDASIIMVAFMAPLMEEYTWRDSHDAVSRLHGQRMWSDLDSARANYDWENWPA